MKKKATKSIVILTLTFVFIASLIAILWFFISRDTSVNLFNSLYETELYAMKQPEYPKMDNTRYFKPDYTSFYRMRSRNGIGRILHTVASKFGLVKPDVFTLLLFENLLEDVSKERLSKKYDAEHILKMVGQKGNKLVVWGDIQGAFHSLMRDLRLLNDMGIIDNRFKIKQGVTFVFNGDVISRSPYIIETFALVLRLIKNNPDQVVYIKGNHERLNYWWGHGLKTALRIRASHLSSDDIPLGTEVNNFFGTLPLSLFIGMHPNYNKDYLRITHIEPGRIDKLNPSNYNKFLLTEVVGDKPNMLKLGVEQPEEGDINIRAVITGLDREFTYEKNQGLLLLPSIFGATSWTIFSCPTLAYQGEFGFKHDAFVILEPGENLDDWSITLYNQDVMKLDGFKKTKYRLLTGETLEKTKSV